MTLYVTQTRKKDLCKMRHGEYIALGKIEAILKTSAAVSNIVVYGSGTFIIKMGRREPAFVPFRICRLSRLIMNILR